MLGSLTQTLVKLTKKNGCKINVIYLFKVFIVVFENIIRIIDKRN